MGRDHVVLDHVSLSYPGGHGKEDLVAIADMSLEVGVGEFVALIGPSGCGKSSLLFLINGLNRPTGGRIRVDGQDVFHPSPERALVFQDSALLPWRSIARNVAMGPQILGVSRAERLRLARRYLKLVGLEEFADRYPHQLSGGMKQRVGIARALCVNPKVLLMDEPFGALDAQTRLLMGEELLRIWRSERKTILFVTHDIDEAVYLADRVVVMTARPSRALDEVRIDLPRPRGLELRNTSAFTHYRERIWKALESEVQRSWSGELGRDSGRGESP